MFDHQGHGVFYAQRPDGFRGERPLVAVTGPQRGKLRHSGLRPYFAVPHGDMMISGCFGLVSGLRREVPPAPRGDRGRPATVIKTKRIYEPADPSDGHRLLIMRRWPRGIKKTAVDSWEPDLGPSLPLLNDYRKGKIDWPALAQGYRQEMAGRPEALAKAAALAKAGERHAALQLPGRDAVPPHAAEGDPGVEVPVIRA